MVRKSVADGLRKGLQREDQALDARFAVADSAMAQMKAVVTTAEPPPAAAAPAVPKSAAHKPAKRASSKPTKPAAAGPVVRESLSMPIEERNTLDQLIGTLRKAGLYEVTRSQLLRAGIAKLAMLKPAELKQAITGIERGRPGRKVN
jgi:hypothetical protein